jgi:hypothetical protein
MYTANEREREWRFVPMGRERERGVVSRDEEREIDSLTLIAA